MSRYRGPKLKIIRRLETSLPGLTAKKVSSHKNKPPGKSSDYKKQKDKKSSYGVRLEEKQKLKFNYGLTEKQLFRYIKEARRRKGVTGLILFQLLEMRLDAICFALGLAKSITQARQFVNHGHITVNSKTISIPSFQCQINDIISIKEKPQSKKLIQNIIDTNPKNEIPSHLKFDASKLEAKVIEYSSRNDISLELDDLLVIEYYSRR